MPTNGLEIIIGKKFYSLNKKIKKNFKPNNSIVMQALSSPKL